jgi:UDP:flavonoid glycosyltransferase YjiC (YdhE family)
MTPRRSRTIALFCMPEYGHFQRLRPLIARIAAAGFDAVVFTHRDYRQQVQQSGGTFVDLFERYPLDDADAESRPVPCRYVSFAGFYAQQVIEEVRTLAPSWIIYDSFAVIAPVVAGALGIPFVNVCAGHNVDPAKFLARLETDDRVAISASCYRAVDTLRRDFHIEDASPFAYVSSLSPYLNIYCEPGAFLTTSQRAVFEPIAFFRSIPDDRTCLADGAPADLYFAGERDELLKLYVSFGTVVWRYFAKQACDALTVIARAVGRSDHVRAVISLGGVEVSADVAAALSNRHVRVLPYVDQWQILQEADLFVTHHGLNSTHEAIYHRVAMVSYPFFWDQPGLANKCQQLGLAIALTDTTLATVTLEAVDDALARLVEQRPSMQSQLVTASGWEVDAIEGRIDVLQRIFDLC